MVPRNKDYRRQSESSTELYHWPWSPWNGIVFYQHSSHFHFSLIDLIMYLHCEWLVQLYFRPTGYRLLQTHSTTMGNNTNDPQNWIDKRSFKISVNHMFHRPRWLITIYQSNLWLWFTKLTHGNRTRNTCTDATHSRITRAWPFSWHDTVTDVTDNSSVLGALVSTSSARKQPYTKPKSPLSSVGLGRQISRWHHSVIRVIKQRLADLIVI